MRRGLTIGIIVAAAVLIAAGALASLQPDPQTAASPDYSGSPSPTTAAQLPATDAPSPDENTGAGEADAGETGTNGADQNGADPNRADADETDRGETSGSETTPNEAAETTPPALVTTPLPETSTAVGSIVPGFPSQVVREAPNSVIDASSVASEGSQLQAALTGQTTLSPDEVLDFYRTSLGALGLTDRPAPAPAGSSALTFTRGINSITLTVTPHTGGCRYTVFGTFTAES